MSGGNVKNWETSAIGAVCKRIAVTAELMANQSPVEYMRKDLFEGFISTLSHTRDMLATAHMRLSFLQDMDDVQFARRAAEERLIATLKKIRDQKASQTC